MTDVIQKRSSTSSRSTPVALPERVSLEQVQ
jgi:hypothetical protein